MNTMKEQAADLHSKSEIVGTTADATNGFIRCPMVDCNNGVGRLLFELFDNDLPADDRWVAYLSRLRDDEKFKKGELIYALILQSQ